MLNKRTIALLAGVLALAAPAVQAGMGSIQARPEISPEGEVLFDGLGPSGAGDLKTPQGRSSGLLGAPRVQDQQNKGSQRTAEGKGKGTKPPKKVREDKARNEANGRTAKKKRKASAH